MPSPLAALFGLVSHLLDRSRDHFRDVRPGSGAVAFGLVVLVTAATTLGIVGLGVAFDATIDTEITVDNPDRPSESTCERFGDDDDSVFAEQCDQPERIEANVGEELRSATGGYLGYGLIGVPIWWVVFSVVLHAGARLAGGTGSVGDSFVIAGWAIAAELLRLVAGVAAIWYALATTTVEGTTIEAIANEVVAAISTMQGPLLAVSAVVLAIQWVLVVGGLESAHDLERDTAGAVAGLFAVLGFLMAAI
ncbi:YIP1 family protein [Halorubrum trueperi]|uniref:YIP1 family protein n=1 Tax=Halorubrum trueperi TaxID=2004704 RepID=A0ABD5UKH5_9EURY